MNRPSSFEKYSRMTTKELAAATAEFDSDFDESQFKSLDEEGKTLWAKARRKRGRPIVGKGVKVVSISLEKGLLAKADKLARRLGISRARLVARGLETLIAMNSQNGASLAASKGRRAKGKAD
jgi:hypothetical protein